MTELWHPNTIRPVLGNSSGNFRTGSKKKGILHTTEGPTEFSARSAFSRNNSWPHFCLTYEELRTEIYQYLPINIAARTLFNSPGGVETNREGCIQAEIVWYAKDASLIPVKFLDGIKEWMRWVETNTGIKKFSSVTWIPYPASYGEDNGIRLFGNSWLNYDGWAAHMHVPENDHGDTGDLNIKYLLETTQEVDEDMANFYHSSEAKTKHYIAEHGGVDEFQLYLNVYNPGAQGTATVRCKNKDGTAEVYNNTITVPFLATKGWNLKGRVDVPGGIEIECSSPMVVSLRGV